MSFLYPGFLFAVLAVVIPIIIHLFNFRKFKKVYFSNVVFLKEIKEQTASQEKLKNLLILLCRIFAIVFLVLAFARPFFVTGNKVDENKSNVVSIYLDNSYSMDAVNKEGSLLDEGKRKAKQIANGFKINDRFQLLTNDFEGRHQRLLNADEFAQAVDDVKISSGSKRLQQVINRQQSIFKGSNNRFIYLISDFQKGFAGQERIKTAASTNLALIKLNANELPNVAVDSVWTLAPTHRSNAGEKIVVRLRNYGNDDAQNIAVKLHINNQQKAISSLNIKAGKTAIDTLSYGGLNYGWQKGMVSIKDFPLTFDDQLNFSFKVSKEQRVLSINGLESGNYVKALFGADPYFSLDEMSEANINYSALSGYTLIVLNEVASPSSGLAGALKNYLSNGGSLAVFPDLTANKEEYSRFLTALSLPAVAELITTPIKVSKIELKNPLFKDVFESLPQNLDLPQVERYFKFSESSGNNKKNILDLPTNQLFFAEYAYKSGRIYLSASGLKGENSNLAKHPLFVPLLYKIAFASVKEHPLYYMAAKDNVLETEKISLGSNQTLKLVSDRIEVIPELRQTNGRTLVYIADQVKQAGFYDLNKGDSTLALLAFNQTRAESDMHYTSEADLQKLFNKKQTTFIDTKTETVGAALTVKNNGTELWKLCLILALVFIAIEVLLIRFYKPKNIKIHEPVS